MSLDNILKGIIIARETIFSVENDIKKLGGKYLLKFLTRYRKHFIIKMVISKIVYYQLDFSIFFEKSFYNYK